MIVAIVLGKSILIYVLKHMETKSNLRLIVLTDILGDETTLGVSPGMKTVPLQNHIFDLTFQRCELWSVNGTAAQTEKGLKY